MNQKFIYYFFPFLSWAKDYKLKKLKLDIIAGITVGLVVVPQSMAYAQLAGLPTYYGLYAAFLPTVIAAFFGSSYHLSTGPTAVVSLMTAVALEPLATTGSEAYLAYAILLALSVGLFRLVIGMFRLGSIINFLSMPVVNGYTSAAAIIIATSQLYRIFGVFVYESPYHYQTVCNVIQIAMNYTHVPTLMLSILSIGMLFYLKKKHPKLPYVLITVALATLFSWGFDYENDIKVNINNIKMPQIKAMVDQFNVDVKMLSAQKSERSRLEDRIAEMKASEPNSVKILDDQYYASLLGIKIKNEKQESQSLRDNLNNVMFQSITDNKGNIEFYKYGDIPQTLKVVGKIWRIKVRNSPIDEYGVVMTGGGSVVGAIPFGFPGFSMPNFDWSVFLRLLPFAVIISLLGFMESISIAKSIAVKTKQRIDPNQELIGQGLANIIGSFAHSYPVSGSFSRSAVNYNSGGQTAISSLVTSLLILASLYILTPVLYFLPKAVLAAVIIVAVISLINIKGFFTAWKVHWYEGAIAMITFIVTLVVAPHLEYGILTGVVLSLVVYLYKSMRPRIVTLSMADDFSLRSARRYGLNECGVIAAIRFDGPLFYANATYLEDYVMKVINNKPKLKEILIVCNGINDIDDTGMQTLMLLIEKIRTFNLGVSFSGMNEKVQQILEKNKVSDYIGREKIFPTQADAIETLYFLTHEAGVTNILACPLMTYLPFDHKITQKITDNLDMTEREISKDKKFAFINLKKLIPTQFTHVKEEKVK